jgi:exosortase/archaeosortase family protein
MLTLTKQSLNGILRQKSNIFYVLAFLPLLPLELYRYFFFGDVLGTIIPLYGFLILLIKKDKLSKHLAKTNLLQKILGITVVVSSFFVYYAVAPFFRPAGFYGVANYTVYLVGLLLIFFKVQVFTQAFTALFLIVASALTGLGFRWIESQMSSTVPYYVRLFSVVLGFFGIRNSVPNPTTISLYTPRGGLPVLFEAGCIGVYSIIVFSIIIVVTMVETPASRRTKLLWSIIGLIGVFVLNIIRLLIVVTSMYFYGYDFGQRVHQVIGYILFLSWLGLFFLLFSKRQTIVRKIQLARTHAILNARKDSELNQKERNEVEVQD